MKKARIEAPVHPHEPLPQGVIVRRKNAPEPRGITVERKLQADVADWLRQRRKAH